MVKKTDKIIMNNDVLYIIGKCSDWEKNLM